MPILYGLPTQAAMRAAAAGRVRLAGCVMTADHDQWACPAGHEWRTGDDQQLVAAINAAIAASEAE